MNFHIGFQSAYFERATTDAVKGEIIGVALAYFRSAMSGAAAPRQVADLARAAKCG
ncbi:MULTISPECIES: hypothetical protein [unclassified Janthinobacterium]|uniref:hypothetical protein n=1 Tax=unclassified Janthinobacterium TaxID=2610881 RepID=UPI00034ABE14|nr:MULTISPECIES: hypothetical protein [unclassified Janthinobacterium]MEC5159436.1 hypothetical protein [Janthinobacterium sp. CG_S6]